MTKIRNRRYYCPFAQPLAMDAGLRARPLCCHRRASTGSTVDGSGVHRRTTRLIARGDWIARWINLARRLTLRVTLEIETMNTLDRITLDPGVCHGKPCIRGLRYPVETVLELLAGGMTTEQVLEDYRDLEREDILAALAYAARLTHVKRMHRLAA